MANFNKYRTIFNSSGVKDKPSGVKVDIGLGFALANWHTHKLGN